MHSTATILEIARLLGEGELSHRQIAVELGVSRGTVSAIANGQRGLHGKETAAGRAFEPPPLPPERCTRCGYRIHPPCQICRARRARGANKRALAIRNHER
jgi:hypothetical protein